MNVKNLALSLFLSLAIASSVRGNDLVITYNHAGLTNIKVTDRKQLQFTWHTGRLSFEKGNATIRLQSLEEGYDSHTAVVWLTRSELSGLKQWIENNGILRLKVQYPESEKKTYGSAFHSFLKVSLLDKTYSLAWTGDTKVPDELGTAINTLVQMCHKIRKARER